MSIKHAILGILSFKPLTGYDIKKIIQESSFMYWSGNNNQVYKALLELHDKGFVTNEVYHQDGLPSKKIYTITDNGLAELKMWSQSVPEAPEIKKSFLVQLAWSEQLNGEELESLLARYEQEIKQQIAMEQMKKQRGYFAPNRTPRETAIWNLIYENILSSYTGELNWINQVRKTVGEFNGAEYESNENVAKTTSASIYEEEKMMYQIAEKNNQKYILLSPVGKLIQSEQDGLELLTICMENRINRLLIHGERLSDDFLQLRTGVAGAVLQKFSIYNIKVAAVLDEVRIKGKFKELLAESNSGDVFRVYTDFTEAENWLLIGNNKRQLSSTPHSKRGK